MKLPRKLNIILDILGVFIPLIVDLILNVISFYTLAPDRLTSIALIPVAVMIVIFIPRAWSKRQFICYIIFVSVVVFMDWSFTLETTRIQTVNIIAEENKTDTESERLLKNIDDTRASLNELRRQYGESSRWDTQRELNKQIEHEQSKLDEYENKYNERQELLATNTINTDTTTELTADGIFNAVPSAWTEKRYIPFFLWLFVFLGMQLVIATSIDIKKTNEPEPVITKHKTKRKPKPVKKVTPAPSVDITRGDVESFVHYLWYNVMTTGKILNKDSFFSLQPSFPVNKYEYLLNRAILNKVIDKAGNILIKEENEAVSEVIA